MDKFAIIRKAKSLKRARRIHNNRIKKLELFIDSYKRCKIKKDLENEILELMEWQLLTNLTLDNIYSALNFIRWCFIIALFALSLLLFNKL